MFLLFLIQDTPVFQAITQGYPMEKINRIIRRKEVEYLTGIGRSAIYRGMQDGTFPKNFSLGGKSVGWKLSDIQGWITKQIEAAGLEA